MTSDLLTELLSKLNPFAERDAESQIECTVALANLDGGEAELPLMLLQTSKVIVIGKGTIDLEDETLNVEFNTQPRQGIGVSADTFVTPFVSLSGTLASPGIGLNRKGVLLQGGAAVLTGGLSAVAGALFDRASGQADHCAEALEEVGRMAADRD